MQMRAQARIAETFEQRFINIPGLNRGNADARNTGPPQQGIHQIGNPRLLREILSPGANLDSCKNNFYYSGGFRLLRLLNYLIRWDTPGFPPGNASQTVGAIVIAAVLDLKKAARARTRS